jgi:uncharacterized protein
MRFVVLILLVVFAVWLVRRAFARGGRKAAPPPPASGGGGDLVRCARCGMHLPRAEAKVAAESLYCSDEHARLGPERS